MKRLTVSITLAIALCTQYVGLASARDVLYDARNGYMYCHPYIKKGLIGAGIGAAAGAVLGDKGERVGKGAKGAAVGAGAGLGYAYMRQKGLLGKAESVPPECRR